MPARTTTLAALLLALPLLAGCGGDSATDPSASSPTTTSPSSAPTASAEESDAASATCEYTPSGQAARPVEPPPAEPTVSGMIKVTIGTTRGALPATLFADQAPCAVNSFLSLAEQDFYADTPCPRIADAAGFGILQCGDPTGTTRGGPGYVFDDELTGQETYPAGTLAMANSGPDTNGSQFFIVFKDSGLAPNYTVFGEISQQGLKVIQKVAKAGNDGSNPAGGGKPNQPISLTEITR